MSEIIDDYAPIINSFLSKSIDEDEFIVVFLNKFKNETRPLSDQQFLALDELFGDTDSYTNDLYLLRRCPEFHIDASKLREKAAIALARLERDA